MLMLLLMYLLYNSLVICWIENEIEGFQNPPHLCCWIFSNYSENIVLFIFSKRSV